MDSFKQSKNRITVTHEFNEEELVFTFKDRTSNQTHYVPYTEIKTNTNSFTEENTWLRNVSFIWIGIGAYFELLPAITQGVFSPKQFLWFPIGIVCFIVYFFTRTEFSTIDSGRCNILVIKDAQHDVIIDSIFDRRNKFLKAKYGEVNFENDLENEIARFNYMLKDKILTQTEYDERVKDIEKRKNEMPIKSPLSML